MAQAFFNLEKKNFPKVDQNYEAMSAGTRPGGEINPMVMDVMKEIGIDMHDASIYFPKPLADISIISKGNNLKRAIIACDDSCVLPTGLPQIQLEKWDLPDPHQQPIEIVRQVREAVKVKIFELFHELDSTLT